MQQHSILNDRLIDDGLVSFVDLKNINQLGDLL